MTKAKDRKDWIVNLVSTDFLRIRKDPDILEAMLTPQKADLATINLGVMSMIASIPQGAFYLSRHDKFLERCYKLFKDSENGTVLQRFCLAVLQKMSKIEVGCEFLFNNKFLFWIVDFLEDMNPKETHSFMPVYLMSAFYNIICADVNQKGVKEDIYTYGKLIKRLLKLFPRPLPGAFYIAVLETIKHFERTGSKWKEIDLEAKVTDTLNGYLGDIDGTFKEVKILDKFKDQIIDSMKLIAGDEKPVGYYIEKGREEEEEEEVRKKEKKGSKKKKKKSKKGKAKEDAWKDKDIRLYRGVLKYDKKRGYEEDRKKVEFEVFKDELNL